MAGKLWESTKIEKKLESKFRQKKQLSIVMIGNKSLVISALFVSIIISYVVLEYCDQIHTLQSNEEQNRRPEGMQFIPAGWYKMGSNLTDVYTSDGEGPVREVCN